MTNYELIPDAVPTDGIAHIVPGYGSITINDLVPDKVIEAMPENLRDKYFKKKNQETAQA
ncbi:hypothetical protein [Flectobacillus roseus]|uniref:hypothetical protein n=1 Tax=Flectobacillus roseus TaxID=502259 RepID=UPI0024B70937|nr:hypothetical protein [Flectobacillus roseus]MDI9871317.1 hypothetical protein [Flectobacillus roseus]